MPVTFTKAEAIEYVKEYFRRKGCELMLPEELAKIIPINDIDACIDLSFRDAKNIILVSVLETKFLSSAEIKQEIRRLIAKVASLTPLADKVYIAIPEQYTSPAFLDGKMIDSTGVGVLKIYEDGLVEEYIPPRPRRSLLMPSVAKIEELVKGLEERISALESHISSLKREIDNLRKAVTKIDVVEKEIRRLQDEISRINVSVASLKTVQPSSSKYELGGSPQPEVSIEVEDSQALPSYARNNEWLAILAKRTSRG